MSSGATLRGQPNKPLMARIYSRFTEVIVDIIVHRAVNFSPATTFKRNSWKRCTYYVCMYVWLIQKLSHTYITTRVYRLTFYAN